MATFSAGSIAAVAPPARTGVVPAGAAAAPPGAAAPPPARSSVRAQRHADGQAQAPAHAPARSWGRTVLQYTPLLAVTVLAKLSLPPLGAMGLGADVPILVLATAWGLASGLLRVHRERLMMYLAMLAWLGCTQLFRDAPFSPASLLLLAALFLPLTLRLRPERGSVQRLAGAPPLARALQRMVDLAALFAALGVLQFALQHALGTRLAYPVEHFVPPAWLIQKFNTLIPLDYGSTTLKSNGVFFLEPSFFSQFMALGLLLELSLRSRPLRVLLLVAGLAVSYSGTGLIVAGVGLLGLVVVKGRWDLLLVGALVVLALVLLDDLLPLQPLLRRTSEFQSAHSSGSARFVAWVDMFDRQWWPEPARVLFGAGAGSFARHAAVARQATAEMSFSKMLFEYGVTGAVLFFGFLVAAMNSVRAPLAFRLGLCTTLLVNGAFVAFPVGIAASVLLWPARAARPSSTHRKRPTP
ncbi:hypothetical protein ACPOLB_00585 [Rubrivivax sp. RP6-9]|uniref:hypothetical protein n=1 Tax=Rubrivivax sp. RP6-9 TaxID=3415750 RepID=UPI003CC5DD39